MTALVGDGWIPFDRPQRDARSDSLLVGGRPTSFEGRVSVSGFKHATVLVLAAVALADGPIRIEGAPSVLDTAVLLDTLSRMGASVSVAGEQVTIDSSAIVGPMADHDQAELIHGIGYLIPALLRRTGHAEVPAGGGCRLGSSVRGLRPTQHYVDVLRTFGIDAEVDGRGVLVAHGQRWPGTDVDLGRFIQRSGQRRENLYSGATKMAILMAAASDGPSTLTNPYYKAEVDTLLDILRLAGVGCEFDRTRRRLVIEPPRWAHFETGAVLRLPPDLIEVVTYLTAGAILGTGSVTVWGVDPKFLRRWLAPELSLFADLGVALSESSDSIVVQPPTSLPYKAIRSHSHHDASPYSDSQPFLALLAGFAAGESIFVDDIWPNRCSYARELRKLGMAYQQEPGRIWIHGPCPPVATSSSLMADDLRGAAVLTLAALAVDGSTKVNGARHLCRGYSDLPGSLASLGANVRWLC